MKKSITKTQLQKTVRVTKQGALVHSTDIAKMFGKRHIDVVRMIEKTSISLCKITQSDSQYFKDSSYINARGKDYKRFELTRKGFDLIALSFTGEKALQFKLWYIDEFHKKTDIIKEHKQIAYEHNENPVWLEFRKQGKEIRTKFTDAINDYLLPQRVAENKETSQFVSRYISSYSKLIYKVLNVTLPKGAEPRDTLDMRTLFKIEEMEIKVSNMIIGLASQDIHYKEIYQEIKSALLS